MELFRERHEELLSTCHWMAEDATKASDLAIKKLEAGECSVEELPAFLGLLVQRKAELKLLMASLEAAVSRLGGRLMLATLMDSSEEA